MKTIASDREEIVEAYRKIAYQICVPFIVAFFFAFFFFANYAERNVDGSDLLHMDVQLFGELTTYTLQAEL